MVKQRLSILMMLFVFGVFTLTSAAQEASIPAWTAWLYDGATGTVTAVGADGLVSREFVLPLAQAFNAYGANIAVSPSGKWIAYLGSDSSASVPNRSLFVYDVALESIVASYQLAPEEEATSLDLYPTPFMFDEATNRVSFGTIFFDRTNADVPPAWKIIVLNTNTSAVEAMLSSDNPNTATVMGENFLIIPVIRRFSEGLVTFMTVYYATGGAPQYPAFTWDIATDEITTDTIFTISNSDYLLTTGEVLSAVLDERLPVTSVQPVGPIPVFNAIQVYDPASNSTYPFYTSADEILNGAYFVQNGERVMVSVYSDELGIVWTLLERDGTVIAQPDLPPTAYIIVNTPDGFLYSEASPSTEEGTRIIAVDTRSGDFTQNVIYTAPAQQYPLLAYVQINAPPSTTYIPWSQVADPR